MSRDDYPPVVKYGELEEPDDAPEKVIGWLPLHCLIGTLLWALLLLAAFKLLA